MSHWWPAALASSMLTWMLCTRYAWPTNDPVLFAIALLAGTVLSYLLCYLIPARLGRDIATGRFWLPQWAEWIARAMLLFGAASSVFWISTWAPWWLWLAGVAMLALRNRGTVALSLFGFGWLVTLFAFQWPGLWEPNGSLTSEATLGDDFSLFLGIALVGVPVSMFAFRQAHDSSEPFRRIVIRGLLTHAVPVAVAVTLSGLNLVTGVRMYWRPSIPIGPEFGLSWISSTWGVQTLIYTWTLLALAPLCAWILWARAAIGPIKQLTPGSIALFAGTIALAWIRIHTVDPFRLQGYDTDWGWSLLALSAIYGFSRVVRDFVTRSAISRN